VDPHCSRLPARQCHPVQGTHAVQNKFDLDLSPTNYELYNMNIILKFKKNQNKILVISNVECYKPVEISI
jgi:hypothetical protein